MDWCCFHYFSRISFVALLEALCAQMYIWVLDFWKFCRITLWWEARRCAWTARYDMEQRQWHQDAVQPVEHQFIPPRKCVQHEWSSMGEKADAVASAFQTAGRSWPSASAGMRSACKNRHNVGLRSRHTVTPKRRVSRVRILEESLLWIER